MKRDKKVTVFSKDTKFLLALHSSTDTFGIGIIQIDKSGILFKDSIIEVKRDLSNHLFKFIEEILPSIFWNQIKRLSVATGPGGYTGTRISVVFARTLAQQLNCPIDGVSSFQLMAHRVPNEFISQHPEQPFWVTQPLKRRGIVAGQYKVISPERKYIEIKELKYPHLLPLDSKVSPSFEISENVEKDLKRLLNISFNLYQEKKKGAWQDIVPIYPTSPIRNIP